MFVTTGEKDQQQIKSYHQHGAIVVGLCVCSYVFGLWEIGMVIGALGGVWVVYQGMCVLEGGGGVISRHPLLSPTEVCWREIKQPTRPSGF